jgi:hypothetical protein
MRSVPFLHCSLEVIMSDKHDHTDKHHQQGHHIHEHEGHEHHGLVEVTLLLEDEHLDALDEVAAEITRDLKQPWDRGAVVRLALSEFFSRRGKIT